MEELVDILDDEGNYTGVIMPKSEAHAKGLFHPTIHVWLYTSKKELLIQQRARTKETFPGKWDVSVAGHLSTGETPLEGALREVEEEIGLQLTKQDLRLIFIEKSMKKHGNGIIDAEFHYVFIAKLKVPVTQLTKQVEEVENLKLILTKHLLKQMTHPVIKHKYVFHSFEYYKKLIKAIP
ncbi:NUDIX domain-containing protein [Zhouia sp. PK063]|uniref:NUDIX hydrolase n=1 Tax=Zhouia sp. PK063 TaxID=3373602 RepID=UPI0037A1B6E4